jgi:hypothetical protein
MQLDCFRQPWARAATSEHMTAFMLCVRGDGAWRRNRGCGRSVRMEATLSNKSQIVLYHNPVLDRTKGTHRWDLAGSARMARGALSKFIFPAT